MNFRSIDYGCPEYAAAREPVALFYQRLGYKPVGDRFVEVTIPHVLMEKHI